MVRRSRYGIVQARNPVNVNLKSIGAIIEVTDSAVHCELAVNLEVVCGPKGDRKCRVLEKSPLHPSADAAIRQNVEGDVYARYGVLKLAQIPSPGNKVATAIAES